MVAHTRPPVSAPLPAAQVAFFFPGQGAQTVGMAVEAAGAVPAAKALFERASDVLGYDLLAVCAEGEGRCCFAQFVSVFSTHSTP